MAYIPSKEEVMRATGQINTNTGEKAGRHINQLGYPTPLIYYYCPMTGIYRPYLLEATGIYNPFSLAFTAVNPFIFAYLPPHYSSNVEPESPIVNDSGASDQLSNWQTQKANDSGTISESFSRVSDLTFDLSEWDVSNFLTEFEAYQAIYAKRAYYKRREQRQHGANYLHGLLLKIDNKSVENIILELFGADQNAVRNMQNFISAGAWEDEAILKRHWQEVAKDLGDEDGVLTVDGSDFPKQGLDSVGVKRQYCGQLGKIANCQAGVFVGYVGLNAYCLLDRRLYLPEYWLSPEMAEKRRQCGVPENITFKTKPELALESLTAIHAEGTLSARWVTCDEAFGRSTPFLDGVAELGLWYFAEVPHNTRVWEESVKVEVPPYKGRGRKPTKLQLVEGEPEAVTVFSIANSILQEEWSRQTIKEGTKGPIRADFAFRRVFEVRDDLPGKEVWLVLRRTKDEIKTYLCNAPFDISLQRLVKVSGLRWPIETCFEESKQFVGMGDYQVRSWRGWHHHMTLVILAHFFLVRLRVQYRDKAPGLTTAQVQLLLRAVLPKAPQDIATTLSIVAYRQHRNRAAYLSHRKRRLAKEPPLAA